MVHGQPWSTFINFPKFSWGAKKKTPLPNFALKWVRIKAKMGLASLKTILWVWLTRLLALVDGRHKLAQAKNLHGSSRSNCGRGLGSDKNWLVSTAHTSRTWAFIDVRHVDRRGSTHVEETRWPGPTVETSRLRSTTEIGQPMSLTDTSLLESNRWGLVRDDTDMGQPGPTITHD